MAKNRGFSKILGRKKMFSKKIFTPSCRTFYCGSFEPSYSHVPLTVLSCSLILLIFCSKMAKNRGFSKFWGRKIFLIKKIFVPSFRTFYCGSFEPSYSYVPLPIEACSPNELAAPPAALATPAFLEVSA